MLTKEECKKAIKWIRYHLWRDPSLTNCWYEEGKWNQVLKPRFEKKMAMIEQLIEEHFDNPPKIDGNTSDGYHTFNELYHHRAVLFSVICNQNKEIAWKSKQHNDGTMYDGMFIVGVDTPQGQYSYHYDIEPYWNMFNVKELDKAPLWDGHEPKDIDRLISLENNPPLKFEELKKGMWVWDNFTKSYLLISSLNAGAGFIDFSSVYIRFSENRFFRKQVEE